MTQQIRFWFEGMSPEALSAYRGLRKFGFTRDAANYMMVGVLFARPDWGRCELGPMRRRYHSARRTQP